MDFDFPFSTTQGTSGADELTLKQEILNFANRLGAPPGKEVEWFIEYLRISTPSALAMKLHMLEKSGQRYPDFWRVGDIVEYVVTDEFRYKNVGERAKIVSIPEAFVNTPAKLVAHFATKPISSIGSKWCPTLFTDPSDVIFICRDSAE